MTSLILRPLLGSANGSLQKVALSHSRDAALAAELHERDLDASGLGRPEVTAPNIWGICILSSYTLRGLLGYNGYLHRPSYCSRSLHHLRARALIPDTIQAPESVSWSFDTRIALVGRPPTSHAPSPPPVHHTGTTQQSRSAMAWQSPSAMNAGGANGGGDGNAPAGTEYTLQGRAPPVDTMHTAHAMHTT